MAVVAMPLILQSLLPPIASAFAVQTITAIPSVAFRTDRFYDLSGALTFVAAGAVSLYLPALRARAVTLTAWRSLLRAAAISCNWRQAGLTGLVGIWAARLGSYLFNRTSYHSDTRFKSIKKSPSQLALAFFTQTIWVSLTLTPVLLVNAAPKLALATTPSILATDVLGLALWAGGFAIETIADWQKGRWLQERNEKVHDEEFMTSGLFSKSRFPNYFGEITAWTGVATVAAGVLAQTPVQLGLGFTGGLGGILATTALSFISPAFVATLLLKVSGVPPSETKYDEKYGGRKEYQEWKKNTPLLVPKVW